MTVQAIHYQAIPGFGFRAGLERIMQQLSNRLERAHQRRALAKLDDRLLRDIGITRKQALTEAGRSFWD